MLEDNWPLDQGRAIIQTEPEATVVTLEFKIFGENEVGEMWIDDVSSEPVIGSVLGGP